MASQAEKDVRLVLGCLVIFVGIPALVLLVLAAMHDYCLGPFLKSSNNQQCVEKRFAPAISGFAAMVDWPQKLGSSYLKGRVVPVDLGESVADDVSTGILTGVPPTFSPNHVSQILHDLPESLVAWNPDQVDTVILQVWKKDVIDHFPSGAAAYRSLCEVTVVDVAGKAVVGRAKFTGGAPPTSKLQKHIGDVGGTVPVREVVAWIKALPRR